jgi:hypothetical protein
MALQIQLRRGNKATWASVNPIPSQGEPCIELDTGNIKIGNGSNNYNTLPYAWTNSGISAINITSTTLNVSGSPLTSAGTIDLELITIGTSGTFTKFVSDNYGRLTSGGFLTSADIPLLPYDATSASILWSRISGTPTTLSGYGITSSDTMFDKKYLSAVSTNYGSVSSVGISSTTLSIGLSPVTTSGTISVNLSLFGTSGTYTKISSDPYGRVISGTTLTSGDIPVLPYDATSASILWSRISGTPTTLSGYGIVSADALFNNKYAQISALPNISLYLPLSGGTLTGAVSGVSANFSTVVTQDINVIASSASFKNFPTSPIEMDGYINSYFQIISQNQSSGISNSTDFIATSDIGNNTNFYIDFGINGSNYSQSANNWYVNGPNDGYIYTQGSNLSIGSIGNSATSGNSINFFVNSTSAQNIIVNITSSGISATNISANSQTLTSTVDSPLTINMSATGGFIHPIIALNTGMSATVGNRLNFDFGLQEATNNAANFGFCYQGNGSANNFITFGVYGTNDLLTISANKTATFLGPVYGSSGIGYNIGSGGQIVQATNKATGVTLNKLTGNIIMSSAALASATTVNFVLTNSFIGANDFVDINHTSAGTLGAYGFAVTPANGSATIFIRNNTNASLSEAIAIKFMVFKAAIS